MPPQRLEVSGRLVDELTNAVSDAVANAIEKGMEAPPLSPEMPVDQRTRPSGDFGSLLLPALRVFWHCW